MPRHADDVKGQGASGSNREGESTEARRRGGAARSSAAAVPLDDCAIDWQPFARRRDAVDDLRLTAHDLKRRIEQRDLYMLAKPAAMPRNRRGNNAVRGDKRGIARVTRLPMFGRISQLVADGIVAVKLPTGTPPGQRRLAEGMLRHAKSSARCGLWSKHRGWRHATGAPAIGAVCANPHGACTAAAVAVAVTPVWSIFPRRSRMTWLRRKSARFRLRAGTRFSCRRRRDLPHRSHSSPPIKSSGARAIRNFPLSKEPRTLILGVSSLGIRISIQASANV